MLGSKALRTCSVCRDRLRTAQRSILQVSGPSSSRAITTSSKTGYMADTKSIGNDIDESVFASHPLTNPEQHSQSSNSGASREVEEEEEEWTPREERRSPAAVFGSKRVGLEVVPTRMEENIQSEINSMSLNLYSILPWRELIVDHHPREIREAFLSSLTTSTKQRSKPGRYNDPSKATSLALAKASTALPGDYAVMSNIVRELDLRLGKEWLDGEVVEISSSHGPGIWYVTYLFIAPRLI